MSCRLKGEHKTGILLVFRLSLPLPASRDVREAELMLFSKTPEIYSVIDEYTSWNMEMYPMRAGAERALLYRYIERNKIRTLEEFVDEGLIAFYVGEELSDYFSGRARIAFASFLRFCRWAGYLHVPETERELRHFMEVTKGRPRNIQMEQEVAELKGRGLAPGPIYRTLRKKYPSLVRASVYRWFSRV